jgi:hypothetical protein
LDELYMMVIAVFVKLVHPRTGEVPKSIAPLMVVKSKKEL